MVIDAGHGGRDPGAIGKVAKEKDIALAIALKLGQMIIMKYPEVNLIYTRKEDKFIELYQRADIANKAKADLFISVHANSSVKKDVNGVEFWVLGLNKADDNLEVAKKENAALQFEQNIRTNYGFDPNSPEGNIIMTMKQSLYLDKSIQLAKAIEGKFAVDENQLVRGTKQAGFVVLYKTAMPSVLVEVGFISNPDEEQYITNEYGQNKIAAKIANAFDEYKRNYENGRLPSADTKSVKSSESKTKINIGEPSVIESSKTISTPIETVSTPQEQIKPKTVTSPSVKASTPSSPSSNVLTQNTSKNRIVIDDEVEIVLPPETKIEPPVSTKKVVDINPPTKVISTAPIEISKKSSIKDTIVNKTINKLTSSPASTVKKVEGAPSYVSDAEIKNQIIDNTKQIDKVYNAAPTNSISENSTKSNVIKTIPNGLVFKVQIKASASKVKSDDPIYHLGEEITESREDGLMKYLVGNFSSMEEARAYQQTIKAKGISDCFVVKYSDGIRVK